MSKPGFDSCIAIQSESPAIQQRQRRHDNLTANNLMGQKLIYFG